LDFKGPLFLDSCGPELALFAGLERAPFAGLGSRRALLAHGRRLDPYEVSRFRRDLDPGADVTDTETLQPSFWRERLAPYAQPRLARGLLDLAASVVPYLALTAAMYALLQISIVLVLALAVPAAGFMLRTFIVFHDCAHGSFLPNRTVNKCVGVVCGLVVFSPFHSWRHEHAIHHATAGDLDNRGMGDVDTLTVAEYLERPWPQRLGYRVMRNPFVLLVLGPLWALLLEPRFVPGWARRRFWRQIVATDLVLFALIGGLYLLMGWLAVLLVQLPSAMLAGAVGVWLFYVQHQFEGVYWERNHSWSYQESALQGSSYLKLPKLLQFFTGNIGLHHVHHLSPRIPNYNLQRAHDENPVFHQVPTLTIWDGIRALRLKLYDEQRGTLVSFAAARD
jgi:omega-6 fatty acid desaturase (delta-12 desaturase)